MFSSWQSFDGLSLSQLGDWGRPSETDLDKRLLFAVQSTMRIRIGTAAALACIVPAAFFMGALIVRNLSSLQNEPARIAQQVVDWYAGRMWKLWALLLGLPLAALAVGCSVLTQNWNCHTDAVQFARQSLAIGLITIAAGGILAIVVLHVLAN